MKRAIQVDGWKLKGFLKRSLKEEIEEIVAEKVQAAVGVWMGEMKTGGHNIGEVLMKALAPKIAEEKDKAEKKVERDLAVLRAKNQVPCSMLSMRFRKRNRQGLMKNT